MVFEDDVDTSEEETEEDDLDANDPEEEVDIDKEALWGEDEI